MGKFEKEVLEKYEGNGLLQSLNDVYEIANIVAFQSNSCRDPSSSRCEIFVGGCDRVKPKGKMPGTLMNDRRDHRPSASAAVE